VDIDNKLSNYLKITGIINIMFRPQNTLNKTKLRLYSTLALTGLLYGSQNWVIQARDKKNNSGRDKIYEKNSRVHLDRL
jgi:hypothetical protein